MYFAKLALIAMAATASALPAPAPAAGDVASGAAPLGRRCTVNLGYNYCVEAEEGAVEGAEKPAVESTEEIKAIE